jgi:hypothetical protein
MSCQQLEYPSPAYAKASSYAKASADKTAGRPYPLPIGPIGERE